MAAPTRLRELREFLGYNQKEFSEVTGFVQGNLSATEQGKRAFTDRLQNRILKQFNVNPVWWQTGIGEIILDKAKGKIPRHVWQDLEGTVLGYEDFALFSDCTKLCEYTGAEAFGLKGGHTIALKDTLLSRVAAGTLIVLGTRSGSVIGRLSKVDHDNVHLKNEVTAPFQIERSQIESTYLLVGVAYRFV